jgi:hypothetical protein
MENHVFPENHVPRECRILERRAGRIKAVSGTGISLHLQHVPVCLNRIAPFGATDRRGPIVSIAD